MKHKLIKSALMGMTVLVANFAHATFVTSETNSFNLTARSGYLSDFETPNGANSLSGDSASDSANMRFSGFDSALGELTGVSFVLTSRVTYDSVFGSWTDNWNNPNHQQYISVDGTASIRHSAQVFGSSVQVLNSDLINDRCAGTVTWNCHAYDYNNYALNTAFDMSAFDLDFFVDNNDLSLNVFRNMSIDTTQCSGMTGSGCQGWLQNNFWSGNATLSFEYTEFAPQSQIPEPQFIAVLALVLLMLSSGRSIGMFPKQQ